MTPPMVRVEAKFKNAALFNAIEAAAVPVREYHHGRFGTWGKVTAFCTLHGLPYEKVGALLRMQISPMVKDSTGRPTKVRPVCLQLSHILQRPVSELFPAELYKISWPTRLVAEVEANRFKSISAAPSRALALPPSQESSLIHDDNLTALNAALSTLTPREASVLRDRFGFEDGHERSLEEIGEKWGVGKERIRQIEAKALRKMRHPNRARPLRPWIDSLS